MILKEGIEVKVKNDLPIGNRILSSGLTGEIIGIYDEYIHVSIPNVGGGYFKEEELYRFFNVGGNSATGELEAPICVEAKKTWIKRIIDKIKGI